MILVFCVRQGMCGWNLLIANHDEKSVIGNTGLLKNIQNIGQPLILVDQAVQVSVDVIVQRAPRVTRKVFRLVSRKHPRKMRGARQMAEKEALVVSLGISNDVTEIVL